VRDLALEDHPEAFEHVRGNLVAPALGAEDLLQAALEVGMMGARIAGDEVLLDLHAEDAFELPVEVELEAPKYLGALNL
jgi:hypothetical protein